MPPKRATTSAKTSMPVMHDKSKNVLWMGELSKMGTVLMGNKTGRRVTRFFVVPRGSMLIEFKTRKAAEKGAAGSETSLHPCLALRLSPGLPGFPSAGRPCHALAAAGSCQSSPRRCPLGPLEPPAPLRPTGCLDQSHASSRIGPAFL